jgi:hypothetical protein
MQQLTLTFPVIMYFPPYSDGTGTTVTHILLEHPRETKRIWGYPSRDWASGLMDCNGWDVPVTRIEGSFERAFWSIPFARLGVWPYRIKLHYGVPRQLTIEQFKGKLINLIIKERGIGREGIKRLKEATSYRDTILGRYGDEKKFRRHDSALTLDIEVPEAGDVHK